MKSFKLCLGGGLLVILSCLQFGKSLGLGFGLWDWWGWGGWLYPWGLGGLGLGGLGLLGPLALSPVILPVIALYPWISWSPIPFLIFLKLLAISRTLLVTVPAVGIGSLAIGSGAGLLAGKYTTLALFDKIEPWRLHKVHYGHGQGWGWEPRKPSYRFKSRVLHYWLSKLNWAYHKHNHFPFPFHYHGWQPEVPTYGHHYQQQHDPFFHHGHYHHTDEHFHEPAHAHIHHESAGDGYSHGHFHDFHDRHATDHDDLSYAGSENQPVVARKSLAELSGDEYVQGVLKELVKPINTAVNHVTTLFKQGRDQSESESSTIVTVSRQTDLPIKVTEEFLEKVLVTKPKESQRLIRSLRQAYDEALVDLGMKNIPIPPFKPIPTGTGHHDDIPPPKLPSDQQELNERREEARKEAADFFALISAFDDGTCYEKLFCDIHTRVKETPNDMFTPYEQGVIALFRALKFMPPEPEDIQAIKYIRAATIGEEKMSSRFCHETYPRCQYNSNQIMNMGNELESSSSFSIPNYLWGKLTSST